MTAHSDPGPLLTFLHERADFLSVALVETGPDTFDVVLRLDGTYTGRTFWEEEWLGGPIELLAGELRDRLRTALRAAGLTADELEMWHHWPVRLARTRDASQAPAGSRRT